MQGTQGEDQVKTYIIKANNWVYTGNLETARLNARDGIK